MPQTWPRRTLNRPSVYAKRQPMMPISISGLIAKQWRGNSPYPSQGRWAIPVRSEAISCGSLVLTGTNLEGLKSQVLISWLMNSHFCLFSRCQQETMSLLLPRSWLYLWPLSLPIWMNNCWSFPFRLNLFWNIFSLNDVSFCFSTRLFSLVLNDWNISPFYAARRRWLTTSP